MFEMAQHEDEPSVRKRLVFYIPGYDPIHPRRYRELYRREGAEQARICGYDIALSRRQSAGPFGWHVSSRIDGVAVETEVEVLLWSDIVRVSMNNGILATYGQLLRTCWVYLSTGAFFRLMRLRKGPAIAALYPIGMLVLQLALALAAAWLCTAGLQLVGLGSLWWATFGVAWYILWLFRKFDNRLYAYYLMHDYAFSARHQGANPTVLTTRLKEFRATLAEALKSDADEVLVVGHSSGAHLAIVTLAGLIRDGQVPANGPALSFLSVGHVVPMVSFLPRADELRRDLKFLSARPELSWVDVSAPGDGCSFALCDPVAVTGVAPENKRWPLVVSAAFTQTLSAERWQRLR